MNGSSRGGSEGVLGTGEHVEGNDLRQNDREVETS